MKHSVHFDCPYFRKSFTFSDGTILGRWTFSPSRGELRLWHCEHNKGYVVYNCAWFRRNEAHNCKHCKHVIEPEIVTQAELLEADLCDYGIEF